jgi:hypothetical protein
LLHLSDFQADLPVNTTASSPNGTVYNTPAIGLNAGDSVDPPATATVGIDNVISGNNSPVTGQRANDNDGIDSASGNNSPVTSLRAGGIVDLSADCSSDRPNFADCDDLQDQDVTFASLVSIPARKRPHDSSRRRKRLPSIRLTSAEHCDFVKQHKSNKPGTGSDERSLADANVGRRPMRRARKSTAKSVRSNLPSTSKSSKLKSASRRGKGNKKSADTTPCSSCGKRFCDDEAGKSGYSVRIVVVVNGIIMPARASRTIRQ